MPPDFAFAATLVRALFFADDFFAVAFGAAAFRFGRTFFAADLFLPELVVPAFFAAALFAPARFALVFARDRVFAAAPALPRAFVRAFAFVAFAFATLTPPRLSVCVLVRSGSVRPRPC